MKMKIADKVRRLLYLRDYEWQNASDYEKGNYLAKRLRLFEKTIMGLAREAAECFDLSLYKPCENRLRKLTPSTQYLEEILNEKNDSLLLSRKQYHTARLMPQYILISRGIVNYQAGKFEEGYNLFFGSLKYNKNLLALVSYALEEYKSKISDYDKKILQLKKIAQAMRFKNIAITSSMVDA